MKKCFFFSTNRGGDIQWTTGLVSLRKRKQSWPPCYIQCPRNFVNFMKPFRAWFGFPSTQTHSVIFTYNNKGAWTSEEECPICRGLHGSDEMEVVLIFGQCGLESSCPRGAITTPIRGVDL